MRKLLSISLLALFIFATVGGIAGMLVMQYRQKAHMEVMVRKHHAHEWLTRLHIPKDQLTRLTWEKPNREFRYQGKMYDVVRSKTHPDGSIEYECYQDDKETAITDAITQHLRPGDAASAAGRTMAIQMFRFFSSLFYQNTAGEPGSEGIRLSSSFRYENLYIPILPDSQDQPPEAA